MTTVFYTQAPTPEWLLMQYAAGRLPPYESMLVAAYLALNNQAKTQFAAFEAEGGRMIEAAEPVSVTGACLDNILAIITPAGATAAPHPAAPAARDRNCPLPAVMRRLLEAHCPEQKLEWRQLGPGIARIDIHLCRSEPRQRNLALLRVDPGRSTPAHRHQGIEITLVLEGSYHDSGRSYRPGDLVIMTQDADAHSPNAGDAGCVCMVLTEGPLRWQNPLLNWLAAFMPG